ncbi:MAG: response regulator [Nitrospirota bacterium]|nr:response regulator [Nitrospirota bacterium]MDP2382264.1 response regulator [Nitrospirota bacterium]
MSILIVDDFEEQRDMLAATLQAAGYRSLLFAESAAEALQYLGIGADGRSSERVDVVLMDLLMPDMDGLEACRRIRSEERLEHLPVIVVTAKTDGSDLTAAYTAGATDYIRKPVIPAELVARVSMAMTLKEEYDNRDERERELDAKTKELGRTVQELKTLRGTLCLCAKCKRVRTSGGLWLRLEDYLEEKLNAKITSGVCTRCGG